MASNSTVLFRFKSKKGGHFHYLFGTMHLHTRSAYTFVHKALEGIQACKNYYAEMDLNEANQMELMRHFQFDNDVGLSKLYSARHLTRMKKIFWKAFQINLDDFENFIPFYIQSMFAEKILQENEGMPLDYYLWNYAKENGKTTGGVETFPQQLEVLKNIPMETQLKGLRSLSRNIPKHTRRLQALSKAYQMADIQKMYSLSKKQLGSLRHPMLIHRNESMSKSIVAKADNDSSFFAVGAAHLAGKHGLINYLKQHDFEVIPVY